MFDYFFNGFSSWSSSFIPSILLLNHLIYFLIEPIIIIFSHFLVVLLLQLILLKLLIYFLKSIILPMFFKCYGNIQVLNLVLTFQPLDTILIIWRIPNITTLI